MRLSADGNCAAAWTARCVRINGNCHRAISTSTSHADTRPVKGFDHCPVGVRGNRNVVAFASAHSGLEIGSIVTNAAAPFWLRLCVCPPMVIVPLRGLLVVFASTVTVTVLSPLPDARLTLAQSRDSTTVQSVFDVTVIS